MKMVNIQGYLFDFRTADADVPEIFHEAPGFYYAFQNETHPSEELEYAGPFETATEAETDMRETLRDAYRAAAAILGVAIDEELVRLIEVDGEQLDLFPNTVAYEAPPLSAATVEAGVPLTHEGSDY